MALALILTALFSLAISSIFQGDSFLEALLDGDLQRAWVAVYSPFPASLPAEQIEIGASTLYFYLTRFLLPALALWQAQRIVSRRPGPLGFGAAVLAVALLASVGVLVQQLSSALNLQAEARKSAEKQVTELKIQHDKANQALTELQETSAREIQALKEQQGEVLEGGLKAMEAKSQKLEKELRLAQLEILKLKASEAALKKELATHTPPPATTAPVAAAPARNGNWDRLQPGMDKLIVTEILGKPKKINKSESSQYEMWFYDNFGNAVFQNEVLTSWQAPR